MVTLHYLSTNALYQQPLLEETVAGSCTIAISLSERPVRPALCSFHHSTNHAIPRPIYPLASEIDYSVRYVYFFWVVKLKQKGITSSS
jgi:hypothetical protein